MKAKLEVLVGRAVGREYFLTRGCELVFGREPSCNIQLFDEGMSRRHFCVKSIGNSFMIEDLNSSNGTYVNGQRVKSKILRDGDEVNVGAARLVFRLVAAPGRRPPVDQDVRLVDQPLAPGAGSIIVRYDENEAVESFLSGHDARQAVEALRSLYRVAALLQEESDLERLLSTTMDLVLRVIKADRGFIFLCDEKDPSKYEVAVVRRADGETDKERLTISRTVLNKAILEGMSVLSADTALDGLAASASVVMHHIQSVLCVPLRTKRGVLGAIYLDNQGSNRQDYTDDDLQLLTAIARQAGAALDRGRLHAKLEKLFQDVVKTLVATIEAKDSYTHGHSERVTEVAVKIAQEMAMDAAYTEKIRLSALLHDIGKIGVSEKILRKPARLTDEEFAQIKKHPVIGADIVENIESLQEEALGVRYHHEKWNGTGYPEGLKGEEIPLIARIICVSDSFDAMTSNRPYRRNFDIEEVVREFERCAQVQFDARVVDAFIRLVKRGDVKPVFLLQAENAPEPERKKSSGVYQAPGPV